MFGKVSAGNGNTTFANFNSKSGLFTISHKAQNAEGSFREHKSTNGTISYREEHEAVQDVLVRRVMVRQEPSYENPAIMENKYWVSVRDQAGKDAVLIFSEGSFAVKVLGLLNAADLSKPVTLVGGAFAEGTKKRDLKTGEETVRAKSEAFLYGVQGGNKLQAKYSDQEGFLIPRGEKVEVRNPSTGALISTVTDWTARNNFCQELAKTVIAKVEAASRNQPNVAAAPASAPVPAPAADDGAELVAGDILGDDNEGEAFRQPQA